MKLRNKKTGEIIEATNCFFISHYGSYFSLAELNAEWEDYKPKEPLVEDEKSRELLNMCFIFANTETVIVYHRGKYVLFYFNDSLDLSLSARCNMRHVKDGRYTRAELCGEEEVSSEVRTLWEEE